MSEIVSGWSDDEHVFLVERDGDHVSARRFPARWTSFFRGMDERDRQALSRSRDVVRVEHDAVNGYTRVDFKNRFARKAVNERIVEAIKARKMDVLFEEDDTKLYQGGIFEGDVGPLRRFLSDMPMISIGTPRSVYLDLEVDSRKRFDDMTSGKARILSWCLATLVDGSVKKVASAILAEDTDASERELIRELFEQLHGFDLVLSWNGDAFDFPCLEMRMNKLRVKLENGRLPIWNRWCWLDHMEAFKKYNQAHESGEERSSFSLNAIGQFVVGEGKTDFDSAHTWEAWAAGGEQRAKLLSYNEDDTLLMAKIEAKTGFVALHIAVCQVTRCFPDSRSLGAAQQGDGYLLALGAARGYRWPTKTYDDGPEPEQYDGAFVLEPKRTGALDDVHVCDFAGMYPSIMRSWNMSLETYVPPFHVKRLQAEGVPMAKLPMKERETFFRTDRRGIFAEALDTLVANRAEYTKKAEAAELGSTERSKYERLSAAYKIIANSFYGIVGSSFTRFFEPAVAGGVTLTGQWLLRHVMATVEATGELEAIYGDTDSVFAMAKSSPAVRDPERVAEEMKLFGNIVASLNESWPPLLARMGCLESRVKLDFEKSFRRLVLVGKKRYAARFAMKKGKVAKADLKPEVKGLEYKRGDALKLARDMQHEVIELLLDIDRPPPSADVFHELVARWRARILEAPLTIEEIVLSQSVKNLGEYATRFTSPRCTNKIQTPGTKTKKGMKSCGYEFGSTHYDEETSKLCPRCGAERKIASQPVHVRVAKILVERGVQVTEGTRIEYLIAGRPEDDEDDDGKLIGVPAYDPGALERIDRDYYWDKKILPPTARLLDAVYPTEKWKETAASRRKLAAAIEKEIASVERKRDPAKAMEGLPLFGFEPQSSPHLETPRPALTLPSAPVEASTPSESPAPAPKPAKPKKPRAPRKPPPLELGLVATAYLPDLPIDFAEAKLARMVEALKAAVVAYPGRSPLTIRIVDRVNNNHIRDEDAGLVARSERARFAIERVVGVGRLRDAEPAKEEQDGTAQEGEHDRSSDPSGGADPRPERGRGDGAPATEGA